MSDPPGSTPASPDRASPAPASPTPSSLVAPARPARRAPSLAVTLLLAMLAVIVLAVGSTYLFANLAVQREFQRLPPEVQAYLRAQQEAAQRGEQLAPTPPTPVIRTGSEADPFLPGNVSSPDVSGVVRVANGQDIVIGGGFRVRRDPGDRGDGGGGGGPQDAGAGPPRGFTPRTQDFLEQVQASLLRGVVLAVLASALLAWALSRRVARPITAVSRAARQLAQGDLTARAPTHGGEREIAELAHTFNDMAANLQALERERQQAVADIAHELRTPIAVMQARLDALEDGVYPLNPQQVALLSTQTQLLTRLVGDLRTLTLADAGRLALTPEPVNLADLTGRVVTDLGDRAAARGIRLSAHAAPEVSAAVIQADPDRLRQMLGNLIENALRHARSRVEVAVSPAGTHLTLNVDDDGPGIPEHARQDIFLRFTRLDGSRSRDTGGSGLGLAIVQALAQAHGGHAQAGQSPLGGARLTVELPRG